MLPFDQCQNTRRNFKCINITPDYRAMQAIVLSIADFLPDMISAKSYFAIHQQNADRLMSFLSSELK